MDSEDKIKQVIVMRKDLNMRKGKMIAQGSHASIAFLTRNIMEYGPKEDDLYYGRIVFSDVEKDWIESSFTKVVVYVNSEEELIAVHEAAQDANINSNLIKDSGLTEFDGVPTLTCLALGPNYSSVLDPITGNLPLL
jgi:PTH2 family peptidyl-tRNA hydrolase